MKPAPGNPGNPAARAPLIAVACLSILAILVQATQAHAQGLRLGGGGSPTLDQQPLTDRIARLQSEIAAIQNENQNRRLTVESLHAVAAKVALRQAAIQLMQAERGDPTRGDLGRWGTDLADHTADLDALLETYRRMAAAERTRDWPRVIAAGQAVQRITDRANALSNSSAGEVQLSAAQVIARAQAVAAELMPLLTMIGTDERGQRPANPWLPTQGEAQINSAAVDELRQLTTSLPADHPARDPLLEATGILSKALVYPEYVARADHAVRTLHTAAAQAALIAEARWLTAAQRSRLADAWGGVLKQFNDADTRRAAEARLHAAAVWHPIFADLNALHAADTLAVGDLPLIDMAITALHESLADGSADTVKRVWLRRVTRAARRPIDLSREGLGRDALRAFSAASRRLTDARAAAADTARDVLSGAQTLSRPSATAALISVEAAAADLVRIARVKQHQQQLTALQPQPSYGIPRRLDTLLVAMAQPTPAEAAALLRQFDEQVTLAFSLPGEAELVRQLDPQAGGAAQQSAAALLQAVAQRRKAWANALASGRSFEEAAAIIEPLHEVMRLRAWALAWDEQAPQRLNRWAGWHAAPDALGEITPARRDIQALVDLVVAGSFRELDEALPQVRSDRADALAVLALHGAVAGQSPLPAGVVGVVSRLAFPRAPSAWLFEHQPLVDRLARSFEAGEPDTAAARALLQALQSLQSFDAQAGADVE